MKNGRIKELAEQAGIFENLHTTQKLAELIIRECIDIAEGTRYDGKVVASRIKFNFGVDNEEIIRKIDDLLNADPAAAEEFENWCRESDDGGEERESNSRFHNFAEGICESYQAGILDAIDAQIDARSDLKAHDEESRALLDELPISNCLVHVISCKTHPDAPHGFLRNASHNADRYVCECEHWEEPK